MNTRADGVTLIELIATLAVLAIVLALAAPSFAHLRRQAQASDAYHTLTTSLAAARMAAIAHAEPVTVCPSRDGRQCRRDQVWEDGWILFLDAARSGQPARAEDILHHDAPGARALAIRSTAGRHWIRYLPSGFSGGSNLSLWICSYGDARELGRIVVNNAGRTRSERHTAPTPCRYRL